MDILWILKDDHEKLRRVLKELGTSNNSPEALVDTAASAAEECMKLVELEEKYLLPEMDGAFPHANEALQTAASGHSAIKRNLKGMVGALRESGAATKVIAANLAPFAEKLVQTASRHLDYMNEGFLPKVRQHISTPQREDLGQVFMDVKEEMATRIVALTGPAQKNLRRKLA